MNLLRVFKQTRGRPIFYGWFVVAAGFAVSTMMGGLMSSFGIFFKPLEAEFSWNRTIISSGFTLFLIGYAISLATSGRLADRYSPRYILLAAAFLSGLGITLCRWMDTIEQFRLFTFIAGLGAGATFSVPASAVQRWFRGRKNTILALAVIMSGFGLGQMIFAPLLDRFIVNYGWRNTYLIFGISFFAFVLASALVIKPSPPEDSTLQDSETTELLGSTGWNMGKALATPAFAGIMYTACIFILSLQIINVHLVPHATDMGISSAIAAAGLGLVGGISIPGRLISVFMARRIGGRKTLSIALFGMSASLVCLLFLTSAGMLYAFVFVFGAFSGLGAVVQWSILSEFFGLRAIGGLIGITSGVSQLAGGAAPYAAGFIFDSTGSYLISFIITIALLFSSRLVIILIKKPQHTLR